MGATVRVCLYRVAHIILYILYKYPLVGEEPGRVASRNLASPHAQLMPRLLAWLAKNPPPLANTFPSDPLGFSQIPGHCATQCRVVVIADMVALTQNKIWVSSVLAQETKSPTDPLRLVPPGAAQSHGAVSAVTLTGAVAARCILQGPEGSKSYILIHRETMCIYIACDN